MSQAESPDGPTVKGMYDPLGHEIARDRLRTAIIDCREFVLITKSPAGTVTFVSCTFDTSQMLEAAVDLDFEIKRRRKGT